LLSVRILNCRVIGFNEGELKRNSAVIQPERDVKLTCKVNAVFPLSRSPNTTNLYNTIRPFLLVVA
jgi:hypothetical protein